MATEDPFRRAGWYGWGILAVAAISIVFACAVSQATTPPAAAGEQSADGPAKPEDVRCLNGWCMVKQDTLIQIVTALQKLNTYTRELNKLCGWKEP